MDNLSPKQLAQLKYQELRLNQEKLKLIEGVPHKFGWKWYAWARAFFESQNKMTLLCAANQISKSSTQIRKCIEWATNKALWPKLWKTQPRQFWYLYPSKDVATVEFLKKWVPEFLPRGEFKDHKDFGWREEYENKKITAIHFNTGVSVYFKAYSQDAQNLQTSTAHAIFCDEELPEELYPELSFRLAATDGHFSMVFTATLGQDLWRRAMEEIGTSSEAFTDAFKQSVSMYDCLAYEDNTPGAYTEERISQIKKLCGTEAEVQRRVYGRFVASSGLIYPAFEPAKHYIKPDDFKLKTDHRVYAAVDPGGGGTSHPGGIVFIAVEPSMRKATVFKTWRGNMGEVTTAGDILEKYRALRGASPVLSAVYDPAAKDFGTIAARIGEPFGKADKAVDTGVSLVNTLFKNMMLVIVDTEENRLLGNELLSIQIAGHKSNKKDNLADPLRYAVMQVPWDFEGIDGLVTKEEPEEERRALTDAEYREWEMAERRGNRWKEPKKNDSWEELEEEFAEWNEFAGN